MFSLYLIIDIDIKLDYCVKFNYKKNLILKFKIKIEHDNTLLTII